MSRPVHRFGACRTSLGDPRRLLVALFVGAAVLLVAMPGASAHTSFAGSTPADRAVLDQPVSEITLTFSGEAEPAGEGFAVLDPTGSIRLPEAVSSTDNLTWTLRFDPPLAGGLVGVRWQVAAPDAHPIDGSFTFTVSAPAVEAVPTASPTPPADELVPVEDSTTAAVGDIDSERVGEPADEAVAEEPAVDTATSDPGPSEPPSSVETEPASLESSGSAAGVTQAVPDEQTGSETITMGDFLAAEAASASGVGAVSAIARGASMLGAVLAVGGLVFVALVLRGDASDIRAVLMWVRRAGALLALSSIVEAAAHVATLDGSWAGWLSPSAVSEALLSSFGAAVMLRAVGGALVSNGAVLQTLDAENAPDPVVRVKQLATVGAGPSLRHHSGPASTTANAKPYRHHGDRAWHTRSSAAAFAGLLIILTSFTLDGHTASEGPRLLHALVNVVHVGAGTTWAGGVVMLAFVIARRHRRGADLRALQLAVRFSVVATVALVAAGIAGSVLTVVILNSVSDLWSTPWGRLLLLKLSLVGVGAFGGAYNYLVLIPGLEANPAGEPLARQFRTIVTIEAVALALVALVTAGLIAASAV